MTTSTKAPAAGPRRSDEPVRRVKKAEVANKALESTKKKVPVASASAKRGVKQPGKISAELRHRMIAEAAFLRAEKRGFHGGDSVRDWLEAEKLVDKALAG